MKPSLFSPVIISSTYSYLITGLFMCTPILISILGPMSITNTRPDYYWAAYPYLVIITVPAGLLICVLIGWIAAVDNKHSKLTPQVKSKFSFILSIILTLVLPCIWYSL